MKKIDNIDKKFVLIIAITALIIAFALGNITQCAFNSCASEEEVTEYFIFRVTYPNGMHIRAYPTVSSDVLSSGLKYGDFIVTNQSPITKGDSTWVCVESEAGLGYVCFYNTEEVFLEELYGCMYKTFSEGTVLYTHRFTGEEFKHTVLSEAQKMDILTFEEDWYVVVFDNKLFYIPSM